MAKIKHLSKLKGRAYRHPADESALAAMKKIPLADRFFRTINAKGIDKYFAIQYSGSNFEVTSTSHKELHKLFLDVCSTLGIKSVPRLYVEVGFLNARAVNVGNPMVILTTDCLEYLDEDELRFILGHELGHVQNDHILYSQIAQNMALITDAIQATTLGIGNLFTIALQIAIMRWYRKSEFTCDRAGLLANQNVKKAISVLAKLAGLPKDEYNSYNHKTFLDQSKYFDDMTYETSNKFIETMLIMNATHPWSVVRVRELEKWYTSGRFEAILNPTDISISSGKSICGGCSQPLEKDASFCTNCGTRVI
jgi:Zn-dependent protease with chaperone function